MNRLRINRSLLVSSIAIGLAAYFGYHAIAGRHGLEARGQLLQREHALLKEAARLESVRSELSHRAALLGDRSIDPDMLDEQARTVLRYARAGDVVIPLE